MKRFKNVTAILMAMVLTLTAFPVFASAATKNVVKSNVSYSHATGNASDVPLKGSLSEIAKGEKAYFNLQVSEDAKLSKAVCQVQKPGGKFETYYTFSLPDNRYFRYVYPDDKYKFSSEGTYSYKWIFTYTNGKTGTSTGSIKVVDKNKTDRDTKITYPMKNYSTKYTQWSQQVNYMPSSRNDHIGVDFISDDKNVYCIADGVVKACGYQKANGNFVVIEHMIDGKKVYSFHGHLDSYSVKNGQSVSAGEKIAVVGKSGSSANNLVHLHFAVVDTLWSSGGYWGYAPSFSGDKVKYDGVTYYNPYYVIKNNRLP